MEYEIKKDNLIEGKNAIYEHIKSNHSVRKLYVLKGSRDDRINYIVDEAKKTNATIKFVDRDFLDSISESKKHKGIIAEVDEYKYFELDDVLNQNTKDGMFLLILDEIEDPHNLGAIIRSASLFGVDGIIIKNRNACQVNTTVISSSAGAIEYVKVIRVNNISKTIEYLKEQNFWVYGLDSDGEDITKEEFSKNICLVVGNEGSGISRLVKEKCDKMLSIKTTNVIDSLNASVAAGISMSIVYNHK